MRSENAPFNYFAFLVMRVNVKYAEHNIVEPSKDLEKIAIGRKLHPQENRALSLSE